MLSLLWVETVPCSRGKGQLVMHLLGFSTSIFSVKCFKLPWLNRWGNGKTEHGKSSVIIKNSSSTKKKHDLSERTLHVCGSWSGRADAHILRCVWPTCPGEPGPGGELCASQEGCVQGAVQGEERPSVPQRQGDEPTGRRGKRHLPKGNPKKAGVAILTSDKIHSKTLKGKGHCNRRENGRAQLLKEWHSPRMQHKQIRTKWEQDGR